MGRQPKPDKKTWTFEPTEEARDIVDAVIKATGWSRTKVMNDLIINFAQTYAMTIVQNQKEAIQTMENIILQVGKKSANPSSKVKAVKPRKS